ncbi:hypothetical protein MKA27_13320 [[Clostridium] innocuum]|uniref:hypothetical protein n=1 Tax=Clostridium innocuum TaxID=1522 RepID=UPI000D6A97C4|nr:hypothetical protein [[Clostridium] innocuum]MCR0316870.1 hypothetical protein [[Clostridium] innocuum]MCR0369688.1 hypothetical protein [[Clostridium] innocuum]MCR0374800.1 hypothetical protein [[Clostridium] innocuum]MCR0559641.1 hypothetical protein [[Clostridium] innocuum]MCR0602665.1 hypothetical protein [[Clostridium] innocuum]
MIWNKKKESTKKSDIKGLHVAICSESEIVIDALKQTLAKMDSNKTGITIDDYQVLPYFHAIKIELIRYKIDLIFIEDGVWHEGWQHTAEFLKEIDENVKLILLTNLYSSKVVGAIEDGIIDGCLLTPYQDNHLWTLLKHIYDKPLVDEEKN